MILCVFGYSRFGQILLFKAPYSYDTLKQTKSEKFLVWEFESLLELFGNAKIDWINLMRI